MRPQAEYDAVQELLRKGMNDCAIARATGIPRGTVRDWRRKGRQGWSNRARRRNDCPICGTAQLDGGWYAYLLGLYLGDGCLSQQPRQVFDCELPSTSVIR